MMEKESKCPRGVYKVKTYGTLQSHLFHCGVLKLFRARPNLICFNLFIYSSQPEQSMADGKIGFKGHFSPKSHLWSLQALEIQASMRSIVIPVDKLLE